MCPGQMAHMVTPQKSLFKTKDSQQTLGWKVAKDTVKSLYSSIFTRKGSTAAVPNPGPGLSPTMQISDDFPYQKVVYFKFILLSILK